MPISFTCGTCGKPYKVDERFAGKKAACRACGTINRIPSAPSVVQRAYVQVDATGDVLPIAEAPAPEALVVAVEEPVRPPAVTPRAAPRRAEPVPALAVEGCPNCGGTLEAGAVFCTGCGYNLKTGAVMATATATEETAEPDAYDPAAEAVAREGAPALRVAAGWLVIGALVASAVAGVGMAWSPLASAGSALALLGALAAMVGALMFFIDGAWEWGFGGAGVTLVAMVLFCMLAMRPATPIAPAAPAPVAVVATPPATAPATAPAPKVVEVSPGKFSVRPPPVGEDPVAYWRPVLAEEDPQKKIVAIGQLAQAQPPYRERAADTIAAVAGDERVSVRRAAMTGLAVAKTADAVAAGLKGLDDPDLEVEKRAAALLGQYREESAITPLVSKYPVLGDVVLEALAQYRSDAREKVVEGYKGLLGGAADGKTRRELLAKLVRNDPGNAGPLLADALNDGDAQVRAAAMELLATTRYEPAVPAIVERLREDPDLAARALIQYGPAAQEATAAKLADTDPKLRLAALGVLKEIATPQTLPAIRAVARDPDAQVALAAREVWRRVSPGTLTPIDEAVMDLDGEKDLLIRALKALPGLPVDDHQPVVAPKLFDITMGNGEAPIPSLACDALAVWADAATRGRVVEALKPDNDDARRALAIRLEQTFKDPRAVRPICDGLAQGKNVPEAVAALKEFGTLSETYLMRLFATGDPQTRARLMDLFREIGTRRCFMVMTPLVRDKTTDADTRKAARETMIAINRRLNTAAARNAPPMMKAVPLAPAPPKPAADGARH
jgi:HEAT repeat protein